MVSVSINKTLGLEGDRRKTPYVPTEQIDRAILLKTERGIRDDLTSYFVEWKSAYDGGGPIPRRAVTDRLHRELLSFLKER